MNQSIVLYWLDISIMGCLLRWRWDFHLCVLSWMTSFPVPSCYMASSKMGPGRGSHLYLNGGPPRSLHCHPFHPPLHSYLQYTPITSRAESGIHAVQDGGLSGSCTSTAMGAKKLPVSWMMIFLVPPSWMTSFQNFLEGGLDVFQMYASAHESSRLQKGCMYHPWFIINLTPLAFV